MQIFAKENGHHGKAILRFSGWSDFVFLKGFLVLTIKLPVSFQDWSPWSECKNEQIKRSRKSCTGRTQTQTHNCNTEGIDQSK